MIEEPISHSIIPCKISTQAQLSPGTWEHWNGIDSWRCATGDACHWSSKSPGKPWERKREIEEVREQSPDSMTAELLKFLLLSSCISWIHLSCIHPMALKLYGPSSSVGSPILKWWSMVSKCLIYTPATAALITATQLQNCNSLHPSTDLKCFSFSQDAHKHSRNGLNNHNRKQRTQHFIHRGWSLQDGGGKSHVQSVWRRVW